MTTDDTLSVSDRLPEMLLQYEIEQFYYHEAALLDAHDYEHWVDLFTEDTHYFMPIRRTRLRREHAQEFTKVGEMSYFDDDKDMLRSRWRKNATGTAWAEDPPSRTRHLIANVRVSPTEGDVPTWTVYSNFHVYRTRLKSEIDEWVGSREDVLRREDGTFRIASRVIRLEQTVLLAGNLTTLF